MSLRDEMMRAISSHPLDDSAATDAALAVVRSHVNRLSDELDAEARHKDQEAAILNDTWATLRATKRGIAAASRDAARRVSAICEEQAEPKP